MALACRTSAAKQRIELINGRAAIRIFQDRLPQECSLRWFPEAGFWQKNLRRQGLMIRNERLKVFGAVFQAQLKKKRLQVVG